MVRRPARRQLDVGLGTQRSELTERGSGVDEDPRPFCRQRVPIRVVAGALGRLPGSQRRRRHGVDRLHRGPRGEPHWRHHRRRRAGAHPHGLAELHAEVSAHRPDAVHRHDVLAPRPASVQVRRGNHGADEEQLRRRPRHAGRHRVPQQHVHGQRAGGLHARLCDVGAAVELPRSAPASARVFVLRAGRLPRLPIG